MYCSSLLVLETDMAAAGVYRRGPASESLPLILAKTAAPETFSEQRAAAPQAAGVYAAICPDS